MAEASNREENNSEEQPDPLVFLQLKSQGVGRDGFYRVAPNKKIIHVLIQHCKHNGLEYPTMKFFHDGAPLNVTKTPAELGLVDGDEINVVGQHDGGGPHDGVDGDVFK